MFDRQSLHIALLVWGCIFSLLAALCMFMGRNFEKEKKRWMILMQLSCAVLLLNDALAWGFRGGQGTVAYYMVRISNFIVFLYSDVLFYLFHRYMCECLFGKQKKGGKREVRTIAGSLIAIVGMVLVVVSQFNNLYYHFDAQNIYHRNAGYYISFLIPVAGMLIDLTLLVQYRKNISQQMFVSMISYIILPFGATIIQTFYYGASLINISIGISMILMFIVAIVEQNQMLAMREKEAADLRISLLLSQIAPHFIYNTLTTIQGLCEKDPALAKETTGQFAKYLRGNLESLSENETIPFARELEHVQCYLAIEKKRFGDRVNVVYDIEEKGFLIPALTLQPVVENAVKYGLCKKDGGGTIHIHVYERNDINQIVVEDDGAGFDAKSLLNDGKKHIGLRNVQSRLRDMCNGTLTITSEIGKGTIVTIGIPCPRENRGEEK